MLQSKVPLRHEYIKDSSKRQNLGSGKLVHGWTHKTNLRWVIQLEGHLYLVLSLFHFFVLSLMLLALTVPHASGASLV